MTNSPARQASEPQTDAKAEVPAQPSGEAAAEVLDTREMLVVHGAIRREFRLLPGLVRATPAGDVTRAKAVTGHLDLLTELLTHHHGGEDRLVWPKLLTRVSSEVAPVVLLMEAQHEKVAAQEEIVTESKAAFAASAGAAEREALASALDRLFALLDEHLGAEEERLLPIAARHLTAGEWNEVGEQGMASVPKRLLPLVFGMMQYEGDPEVLANMLSTAPPPIRLLIPRLARRAYRRYALKVHGTATP